MTLGEWKASSGGDWAGRTLDIDFFVPRTVFVVQDLQPIKDSMEPEFVSNGHVYGVFSTEEAAKQTMGVMMKEHPEMDLQVFETGIYSEPPEPWEQLTCLAFLRLESRQLEFEQKVESKTLGDYVGWGPWGNRQPHIVSSWLTAVDEYTRKSKLEYGMDRFQVVIVVGPMQYKDIILQEFQYQVDLWSERHGIAR
jgi:hypothetical protein